MVSSSSASRLTATFDAVDIRSELHARPTRAPNHEQYDRAFAVLATEMAENPRNMLQKLVEVAVDLCKADTAGVSLLDGDVFRWEAVADVFAGARGGTMPRNESPCGVCIDSDSTQLMYLVDRCFPALFAEPRFVEALLIPFMITARRLGRPGSSVTASRKVRKKMSGSSVFWRNSRRPNSCKAFSSPSFSSAPHGIRPAAALPGRPSVRSSG